MRATGGKCPARHCQRHGFADDAAARDEGGGHAKQPHFGRCAVGDEAAFKPCAAADGVGAGGGYQPAGAAFSTGKAPAALAQGVGELLDGVVNGDGGHGFVRNSWVSANCRLDKPEMKCVCLQYMSVWAADAAAAPFFPCPVVPLCGAQERGQGVQRWSLRRASLGQVMVWLALNFCVAPAASLCSQSTVPGCWRQSVLVGWGW